MRVLRRSKANICKLSSIIIISSGIVVHQVRQSRVANNQIPVGTTGITPTSNSLPSSRFLSLPRQQPHLQHLKSAHRTPVSPILQMERPAVQ
ncbi:hypothetical protein PCANC_07680 [Puccinia coronata f. sp. avenae]|uniref:Uncharacterized protein n=1 Tax=Puccinia coronata f. sp. avenae TaxID=200324 RepID=A0A2N5T2K6_9BASI|nr:hypothetical protein PCANC_07680 [Puccinia coronata f. sp. avenae]